jgi:hypothetical protein
MVRGSASSTEGKIPGILYRLSVFEANHEMARGFPKIYSTEAGFKAAVAAAERNTVPGRYWIKEGCARGPWLSLDGPVVPEVDHDLPPAYIFYEAA